MTEGWGAGDPLGITILGILSRELNMLKANPFEYIPTFIKTPHYSLVDRASPNRCSPMRVTAHAPVPHSVISINIYGSVGRREGPVNRQVCILKSIFK